MAEQKKRGRPAKKRPELDVLPNTGYCRKCMQVLPLNKFFAATDMLLDSNGKMSVCKSCIEDIFEARLHIDMSIEDAVLYVCRALNIYYDPSAIESARKEIQTLQERGTVVNEEKFFGKYKAKLGSRNLPPHFIEPVKYEAKVEVLSNADETQDFKNYLVAFWGSGLTLEQYDFLESELARWKRTHKCDNTAEETLLREICFTQLEIREARQTGKSPDGGIRRLQELMKTASLDPAKANAASAGKSVDTFGQWIKEIEEKTPAEWYKDQDKFRDIDGLNQYLQDFITRPIKNFVTGSRDFNVKDLEAEIPDDDADFDDEFNEEDYSEVDG